MRKHPVQPRVAAEWNPSPAGILLAPFHAVIGPLTRENGMMWIKIILIVLVLRWAIVEPFSIPSGSMEPTLHGDARWFRGDHVFVNKWIYGLRFPFEGSRVPFTKKRISYAGRRIWQGTAPKRWDIVVFKAVPANAPHNTLIKRIVGLPGERIHISNGRIYVNGAPAEPPAELRSVLNYNTRFDPSDDDVRKLILECARRGQPPAALNLRNNNVQRFVRDIQRLHPLVKGRVVSQIPEQEAKRILQDIDPITWNVARDFGVRDVNEANPCLYGVLPEDEYSVVPADHYLVLGDNSASSVDGRVFGWLPGENIVGRAFCVWWPLTRLRDFTGFSQTWWGRLLLFGIPAMIVLYEVVIRFFWRSLRIPHDIAGGGIARGEHVLVNRIVFGLRYPFSARRLLPGRTPLPGEIVLYRVVATEDGGHEFKIGRVAQVAHDASKPESGGKSNEIPDAYHIVNLVPCGDSKDSPPDVVNMASIFGSVQWVWRPLHRIRRIPIDVSVVGSSAPTEKTESD
ncbi:MAG: signal peptidase I [Candidatus Hydrogenedentes bacterium]|nr:signal peptidase I [Candidatus Hydrogenedentota bacterium]